MQYGRVGAPRIVDAPDRASRQIARLGCTERGKSDIERLVQEKADAVASVEFDDVERRAGGHAAKGRVTLEECGWRRIGGFKRGSPGPVRPRGAPSTGIVRGPNIFGAGLSTLVSEPRAFARHLQDRKSDTGYDTRRRAPDGVLARVSQTTVYDTCRSTPPASRRQTAPSRWKCRRSGGGAQARGRGVRTTGVPVHPERHSELLRGLRDRGTEVEVPRRAGFQWSSSSS